MTDHEPASAFHPVTPRDFAHVRAAQPDYWGWLAHVTPASGCTRPIRLSGAIHTVEADTGRILSTRHTADMPDGVIYKACGNRRASVCTSCSDTYQRDAYQLVRAGLVGGKGIPDHVATHPCLFATLTAPGFGPVHTRHVARHTCANRRRCDCRSRPCHPGRPTTCPHGQPMVCFARHETGDAILGQPICLDCYDHSRQVVFNSKAGELWRRTTMTVVRHLRRTARTRGVDPATVRVGFGKVAEMQRRGVIHFHAVIRLDGADPDDPTAILPPPQELGLDDLVDAVEHAAKTTMFMTDPHPDMPTGWLIAWGEQHDIRPINLGTDGAVTDCMVAGYLAKYASKATETTGHTSQRLTADTIDLYADPDGTHTERLVEACWILGRTAPWQRLRRWAHMLGFGGHFLTKSRRYTVTFRLLRHRRVVWQHTQRAGPEPVEPAETPTVLMVNFLDFVGAGWHTTGDALLANSAAAKAREQRRTAREELTTASAN
jgi:Replication initiator protein, pSAM2